MYIVKNQNGDVVLVATRREDTEGFVKTELDDETYTVEESSDEQDGAVGI